MYPRRINWVRIRSASTASAGRLNYEWLNHLSDRQGAELICERDAVQVGGNALLFRDLARELGLHNRQLAKHLLDLGVKHGRYSDDLDPIVVERVRGALANPNLIVPLSARRASSTLGASSGVEDGVSAPAGLRHPSTAHSVEVQNPASSEQQIAAPGGGGPRPASLSPSSVKIALHGTVHDHSELLLALRRARREASRLVVDVSRVSSSWPNWVVPIAALIQYFRSHGTDVSVSEEGALGRTYFRNPIEASQSNVDRLGVANVVYAYFDEKQALVLTNALVAMIQRSVELGEGVQHSLKFCLFEILDNVFQHSQSECGYLMAALTNNSTRLSLTVVDTGVGVFNSFVPSKYKPASHFDALTLAVQEGVTSTGDKRGNGLFALQRTVQQNQGRLELKSGYGYLLITNYEATGRDIAQRPVIDDKHHGLTIDWQIDLRHPVSLDEALGMHTINDDLEQYEDDLGNHVVFIAENDAGTGSRKAAAELRNYLVNIVRLGARRLTLDFTNVEVVSSSFADEVIGKLAEDLGPIDFFATYEIRNASYLIKQLLDRAIRLRLSKEAPQAITRQDLQ